MHIETVTLKGFRNYSDATINFEPSTLIIGANDVGKTNLVYAIRILLDKSISELDLEPKSNDFHVNINGDTVDELQVIIKFKNVDKDAVVSKLNGYVSDEKNTYIKYVAYRNDLSYKMFIGHNEDSYDEITSRFYLKYLSMRYIKSQRDLDKYISLEKRHLLRLAQENREQPQVDSDQQSLRDLNELLENVNSKVKEISYVKQATAELNSELRKLSYNYERLNIELDSGAIGVDQFIEKLELSSNSNGHKLLLGGDGLNNQILLALWKSKSVREHDENSEVVIYCIEEPEAHLYPHQQRKLSEYLTSKLPGQSIVTTHSPQIAVNYQPDSIIKIYSQNGASFAASNGCSKCVSQAWDKMGYRISIIPAEAFFADVVFLVEGPSELIFYNELAKAIGYNLDFYNISILSVDGVQFEVYTNILKAFNIKYVVRTDNDAGRVPHKDEYQYSGINRSRHLCGLPPLKNELEKIEQSQLNKQWIVQSPILNACAVFLSFTDLEGDLCQEFSAHVLEYSGKSNINEAANYLRDKKATRMRELIALKRINLSELATGDLVRPLLKAISLARGEI